jgi:hypothetical protein
MPKKKTGPHLLTVLQEQNQAFSTRRPLLAKLGKLLDRPIVSFYTAFNQNVGIENDDADMLEGVLQQMDLSRGLGLIIGSPGGDGMAAERIVNICRTFSGTGEFVAIVLGKAKSAATLVCFGASKILMGRSSELGPVDPQVRTAPTKAIAAYDIIKSYEDLLNKAVKTKGNLQPFLLQLQNYDPREIQQHRSYCSLSIDIAVKNLSSGMMSGVPDTEILKKIKNFVTSETTKVHARAIFRNEARGCGITVEDIGANLQDVASELHVRTSNFVTRHASKCIETEETSWTAKFVPWS